LVGGHCSRASFNPTHICGDEFLNILWPVINAPAQLNVWTSVAALALAFNGANGTLFYFRSLSRGQKPCDLGFHDHSRPFVTAQECHSRDADKLGA
jgi:hypothetical protein